MDKKLFKHVLEILENRSDYWYAGGSDEDIARGAAYETAATIVRYAMEGNVEAVNRFDDYI